LDLAVQIRFILLQNRQGKTRLAKYYVPLEDSEKHKVEYEVRGLRGSPLVPPDSSFGLSFVDPVSSRWFTGAPAGGQSGPQVHQLRGGMSTA
jgi:hypothetical protein